MRTDSGQLFEAKMAKTKNGLVLAMDSEARRYAETQDEKHRKDYLEMKSIINHHDSVVASALYFMRELESKIVPAGTPDRDQLVECP
jgi:hypothetical protein